MVSMDMSFVARAIMLLIVSFSLAPATATGLRSAMPVRTAAVGRLFRGGTASTRGASSSIRATSTRTTCTTSATTGSLFVLSKGSPNSERM